MRLKKLAIILAAGALSVSTACSGSGGDSSEWPTKGIQLIAPYGAGGDTDFNARTYARYLEEELGETVTVVNVSGSGGVVGSRQVKDSRSDGYTALYMHPALMVNQTAGNADYGLDEFTYVATVGASPGEVITVNSSLGVTNLEELREYATAHPGELTIAADVGTMTHVNALQMLSEGIDANIVSAGGASERVGQLMGGHVDVIINSYGTVADYIKNGDFVGVAHTGLERAEGFPDIATAQEQGFEIYMNKQYFVLLPDGVDEDIVAKWVTASEAVIGNEEYQEAIFDAYGQEPVFKAGDEGLNELRETAAMIEGYKDDFS